MRLLLQITFLLAFFLLAPIAASAKLADVDTEWRVDLASTFQFLNHTRATGENLGAGIQTALLHTQFKPIDSNRVSAHLGLGVLERFGYNAAVSPYSPIDIGLQYAWISLHRTTNWQWQIGQLQSKLRLESALSNQNNHILHSALSQSHSFYYPGVRTLFQLGTLQFYMELNGIERPHGSSWASGMQWDYRSNSFIKLNAMLTDDEILLLDLSGYQQFSWIEIGGTANLFQIYDELAWRDDEAFALAGYLKLSINKHALSLRSEFISDGNTGIYGNIKAGFITLTHSYKLNRLSTLRHEFIYSKSQNPVYRDNGQVVQDQFSFAIQLAMAF
ncbi:MAG: hypothetical protein OEY38_12505 [Gammaproteobacteria bacterium]|nr:hypothetical protein [Gammaproteobacteria bacterium]